jgi:GT2 family glycosyltransferase
MIDVIIPVYDGYEETKQCIESVLTSRNNVEYQVIIINDNSPNMAITDFLNQLKHENVKVLKNEQNLGFVKTVNKGMKLSKNDVILLNSDTVVTNYWIDKLYKAAYSNDKIGTVTPLTNNGTIASVPYFNKDNDLPEGYTIEQFSQLIERISDKTYPIIPTAVGHAMYIKRKVINEIGYFDEESFGMGYGEENDFSCRVIKRGYKNILADDTFIFHYGSTSFKSNKAHLIAQNRKKLLKKHWWYPIKVKSFLLFDKKVKNICKKIQDEINRNVKGIEDEKDR